MARKDALNEAWDYLSNEIRHTNENLDRLTKRSEVAGMAFSAPSSTEADAPLAADGMQKEAFRFINGMLHYYRPDIDAWLPIGEWNHIASDLDVAAPVAEFDIQNIIQSYDEWKLTLILRGTTGAVSVDARLRLNGDATAGNYTAQYVITGGTAVSGARDTTNATIANIYATAANSITSAFSTCTIRLFNVIDTSKIKFAEYSWTWIGSTVGSVTTQSGHGIFNSTSAINRIQVIPASGNWAAGSGWLLEGKRYR